jgi:hypothetical protein
MKYIIQINTDDNTDSEISVRQSNIKQICSYLDAHKISYKYSPTSKGFIIDCLPKQFDKLLDSHGKIIRLFVKDTKIILQQQKPATLGERDIPTTDIEQQWGIHATNVELLWKRGITGQDSLIAFFDTGTDRSHRQLHDNYSGIWKDFINDVHERKEPYDDNGHGTFVCGIACGNNVNNTVIGIAPDSKWMSYKILNSDGIGNLVTFVEACDDLIENNIRPDVISCCFSLAKSDGQNQHNYKIIFEEVISVMESQNILMCFPAEDLYCPSNLSRAFTVGSFDISNKIVTSDYYNEQDNTLKPDVVGPGINILSCIPKSYLPNKNDEILCDTDGEKYCMFSGASISNAYVSGSVALIVQCLRRHNIEYDCDLIKDLVTQRLFELSCPNTNKVPDDFISLCRNTKLSYTLPKQKTNNDKHVRIIEKYAKHPIRKIINSAKPLPKPNKLTLASLNPKFPYLDLSGICHYLGKN